MKQETIHILTGPTAVGKSTLAMQWARLKPTQIISADVMQVYRGMDIGTAKPSILEQQEIKHHLIDSFDPDENYSVAQFVDLVTHHIEMIRSEGATPLIVGGAGFYLRALIEGFTFANTPPQPEMRRYYQQIVSTQGSHRLHEILRGSDPGRAEKISPNDTFRLIRALEINNGRNRTCVEESATSSLGVQHMYHVTCLLLDRETLYRKIEERVEQMLGSGLVEEVRTLQKIGYNRNLPALQAIGYKEVWSYLEKSIDYATMVSLIKRNSRHLAKRQMTWFRSFSKHWGPGVFTWKAP